MFVPCPFPSPREAGARGGIRAPLPDALRGRGGGGGLWVAPRHLRRGRPCVAQAGGVRRRSERRPSTSLCAVSLRIYCCAVGRAPCFRSGCIPAMGVGYSSLAPDEAPAGPARSPCAADGGSQVAVGRSSSTADNAAASRKAAGAASARTAPAEVAASKKGPSPPPPPPRVKRPRAAHLTAAAPDGTGEFAAPAAPSKPAGPTLRCVSECSRSL